MSANIIHYDPAKSHLSNEMLAVFLSDPDLDDMKKVPGIGLQNWEHVLSNTKSHTIPLTTGYGLLAAFIAIKAPGMPSKEICDRFYGFLVNQCGVDKSHAHMTVRAIAERANVIFPGFYHHERIIEEIGIGQKVPKSPAVNSQPAA